MLILGLIDSKPSAAALLDGGRVLAAIAEERLCRMKMAHGVPRAAIARVLEVAEVGAKDVDAVAVAQLACPFEPEPRGWTGWFDETQTAGKVGRFEALSGTLAPLVGRVPVARAVHQRLKRWLFRDRLRRMPGFLRQHYGLEAPIRYFDHHFCHATSAYYACDLEPALVVTLDGGGDGRSGSVWVGEGGRLRPLAGVESFNSLGNFYSYVTHLCRLRAERDEGKVTGLAAHGEPRFADVLRRLVHYQEPGKIRYQVPMYHHSAVKRLAERLPEGFDRADLAASVQVVLEEVAVAFIRYWLQKTGLRHLAVAGGVFANVKLNQRLHELPEVERLFIYPAMDDSGLAVGGALAGQLAAGVGDLKGRLGNVYFGPASSDAEIEAAVRAAGFDVRPEADLHEKVADLLAKGHVVARFTGRMEYGPRALGNRSILYQTTDPSVNDWLNDRLVRTEFMPFAPATLVSHAGDCYVGLQKAGDPARFMTVTFDCTPEMAKTSPGVVHVDGTARPQVIDPETAPDFHAILSAYHRRTGIPSLINTSFNMHDEPIVCTPDDALRAFQMGHLDYLAIGPYLLAHPEGPERLRQSVARD